MLGYRAFIVGANGHIQKCIEIECPNDEQAKERAKQLVDGHDIELWQLNRKIAEFKRKD